MSLDGDILLVGALGVHVANSLHLSGRFEKFEIGLLLTPSTWFSPIWSPLVVHLMSCLPPRRLITRLLDINLLRPELGVGAACVIHAGL